MAQAKLLQLPTEIIEIIADYLGPSDVCALRSTCTQANAKTRDAVENAQLFHAMAQLNFSICKTSLTGSELEQLCELAEDESVRGYIKEIHIEDDFDGYFFLWHPPSTEYPFIWDRDATGLINSPMQGIKDLNMMLRTRRLCPEVLTIRDYQRGRPYYPIGSEAVATLAKDALEDSPLAIISLDLHEIGGTTHLGIEIEFSSKHHGPEAQFAMLSEAHLLLAAGASTSYWTDRVFYRSPALKKLHLRPHGDYNIDLVERCHSIVNVRPFLPSLSELRLDGVPVSEQTFASILSNSLPTLSTLSLCAIRLLPQADWSGILSFVGTNCVALTAFDIKIIYGETTFTMVHFSDFCHENVPKELRQDLEITSRMRGPRPRVKRPVDVIYKGSRANEVVKTLSEFVATCNRS